jgi:2'-5' RNA ligase
MFVALDLEDAGRRDLGAWRDRLVEGRQDLRPVPERQLHVTLAFLGWQDESAAGRIAAAAFAAAAAAPGVPQLVPAAVRAVPPRDPRLFALDLEDAARRAAALQEAVAGALEDGGFFRRERRPFWVHLTLARVKRRVRRAPPLDGPPPPPGPLPAPALTLYRSVLRPQGALYEPLDRLALPET